jgi:purine-nucleoside phosphorylase
MESASPEPAIVRPVKGRHMPDIGPLAVLAATGPDVMSLKKADLFNSAITRPLYGGKLIVAVEDPSRVSLCGPFIGAPYGAMMLETLIAWGARRFIFLGWCGAVAATVHIGDIIVPTGAFIDEGTSLHYLRTPKELSQPDGKMVQSIKKALNAKGMDYHEGLIWTTDGVFRETREKVISFRFKGALAVEMEMSALWSVAAFHRVQLAGILVVSDDLSTLAWEPGFGSNPFKQGRMAAVEVVASLCRELA